MVRITEDLVRKKAEHNEGIIGTLEELQILYLQANLISKIENLNKLKKLQYLNLAINNIEVIENLERCESLEKLDLTLNFVGDLESVCCLKDNVNLRELILTVKDENHPITVQFHLQGNPCCEYRGYREYVIAKLPQLTSLDVKEITRSERIKAAREVEKGKEGEDGEPLVRRSVRLFSKDGGRPLNVNQAKLDFEFSDADPAQYVLDVAIYKFLDANLIDVDLQPIYVKITIKGKIFQIVFPEEIHVEKSSCQRSQSSGHLILKMPKVNYKQRLRSAEITKENTEIKEKPKAKNNHQYLEVEEKNDDMDYSKIVERNNKVRNLYDNPEIPPLEYC
nr:unnamed protein product [Callosobruchus analis]